MAPSGWTQAAAGWQPSPTTRPASVYEVNDPVAAARAKDPLSTLKAVAQAAILAQIETMAHEALLGMADTPRSQSHGEAPDTGKSTSLPPEEAPPAPNGADPGASSGGGASPASPGQPRGLDVVERGLLARLANRRPWPGCRWSMWR